MTEKSIKLLVFSDSHGRGEGIRRAIEAHGGRADALIFLGDGIRDALGVFADYPQIPHIAVRGNNDFGYPEIPQEVLTEEGGVKILCMHGHGCSVKGGLERARRYAADRGASLLLFGHTHEALDCCIEGIRLFNPGSVGLGRPCCTYGVINIYRGQVLCSHGKL